MKYKLNEKKDDKIKIDFELNAKEWEEEVENAYQKNKMKYKKEGFRQGKVPRKVLESTYGEYLFYEDALNDSFPKFYAEVLKKEKNLFPIDYPEISVSKMDKNGISFTASIDLLPTFSVEKYEGFKVEKAKAEVTKAEITKELNMYAERHARYEEIKDRPIKKGDLVNLDYSGSVDGNKFDGGTAKDQELEIGSNTFIPGFEDQMIGMNIGEEKDLKVKFPEDYHSKDLAGKESVFAVKVLGIREKQIPKIDDEFAKEVSEFESLQALTLSIEEKLSKEKSARVEREAEDKLIKMIVDGVELKVPSKMVEKQLDYYVDDLTQKLSMQGLTKEMYFQYLNTTEDAFRKERKADAERSVKTSLVMEEIINKEKIKVSDKEIEAKIEEIAKMYNQTVEQIKATLEGQNGMQSVTQDILSEKVVKLLKEKNSIV